MLLTSDLIYDRLCRKYDAQLYLAEEKVTLRSVLIYDGKKLSPGKAYIMTKAELDRIASEASGFLAVCSGCPDERTRRFDVLYLIEETQPLTLLEDLSCVFEEFHEWEEQMSECPDSIDGIQRMLELTGKVMGGALLLVDAYYNFVAATRNARLQKDLFDPADPKRPSQEILQNLVDDPAIYEIINTKEPFLYPGNSSPDEASSLCLNLFMDHVPGYYYRILYTCDGWLYPEWKKELLKLLGKRIMRIACRLSPVDSANRMHTDLANRIRAMLLDPSVSAVTLREPMRSLNWDPEDQYQIYVFYPFQRGISPGSGEYVRSRLELYFQDSCSFLMDDTIVMIHNLTRSYQKKERVRDLLSDFLKEHLYKVGISIDTVRLSQIRYAYLQARTAYRLGSDRHPHYWYYKFEDYILDYVLSQSTAQLPATMLMPKVVTRLQEYDAENDTELLRTLQVYIQEKYNATHAAQKLYIHRTTFLDRLERIKTLTNADLDSWDSRMLLMIALKLLNNPA